MASFTELAPSAAVEEVKIEGKIFAQRGLSSDDLFAIIGKFPKLEELLAEGANPSNVNPVKIGLAVIGAVGPIIAAGYEPSKKDDTKVLSRLPLQTQLKLLVPIWKLTFPDPEGPFGQQAALVLQFLEGKIKIETQSTSSPETSSTSSTADILPMRSGA